MLVCISLVQDKWGLDTSTRGRDMVPLCLHSKENQRLFEN